MDGWREAEREREKFMPSHDDSRNTEQVKLCRHIDSQVHLLGSFFLKDLFLLFGFSSSLSTRLQNLFPEEFKGGV